MLPKEYGDEKYCNNFVGGQMMTRHMFIVSQCMQM